MAAIAQLGERQTEDLEVPSSILGHGICHWHPNMSCTFRMSSEGHGESSRAWNCFFHGVKNFDAHRTTCLAWLALISSTWELNNQAEEKKACVAASARVWYLEPKWLRCLLVINIQDDTFWAKSFRRSVIVCFFVSALDGFVSACWLSSS